VTWVATRKEYLKATAPVGLWEKLFDTTFYQWLDESPHALHKEYTVRALEYSIPDDLAQHIEHVFNTVQAPPVIHQKYHRTEPNAPYRTDYRPNLRRVKAALAEADKVAAELSEADRVGANNIVTVAFLNSFYGITSNTGSSSLSQSVFETANEYYSQSDLTAFQTTYGLPQETANDIGGFETSACSTDDYYYGSKNCDEGNLDIQYIMGVSQGTASNYWYVAATGNPYVTWITDLASDPNPSQSNSMSWGSIEQVVELPNSLFICVNGCAGVYLCSNNPRPC
jgi:hypothetical protein